MITDMGRGPTRGEFPHVQHVFANFAIVTLHRKKCITSSV